MIQGLNKLAKSWVAALFLGGMALALGLWNIGDVFRGQVSTDDTLAPVGSSRVSVASFQRQYNETIKQMSQQNPLMTPDMMKAMGLPQRLLQSLIDQAALDNVSGKLGLGASDEQVD